ncbi:MAG: AsmA-like C-terminal region-containing protein [Rickettsiales bacterium]
MRGKFFLVVFFLVAIFGGAYYYYGDLKPHLQLLDKKEKNQTVVQILPFPVVLADSQGQRNSSLYDLLKGKTKHIVSVSNARLDFSGLFKKKDMYFDGAFINFSYNEDSKKVHFNGTLHGGAKDQEINGDYYFDGKNNIILNVKFSSDIHTLNLQSTYTPSGHNLDEGTLKGQFAYQSNDLFNSSEEFANLSSILGVKFRAKENAKFSGEFEYEDEFKLKNTHFISDNAEFSLAIDTPKDKRYDLISSLNISRMNLDGIFQQQDNKAISKFVSLGSLVLSEYAKGYELLGEVKANGIQLNKTTLNNLEIDIDCNEHKRADVKKFQVQVNKNHFIYSKGTLDNDVHRPKYHGDLVVKSNDSEGLLSLFGFDNADELAAEHNLTMKSKIILTPVMMDLSDFKVEDSKFNAQGDLRISYYPNDFKSVYAKLSLDDFDINSDTMINNFVKRYNFLTNSNKNTFTQENLNFRKFKSIYDVSLNFNNLKYGEHKIDLAKAQIVLRNDAFNIHDIHVESPMSNFTGHFGIDTSHAKPYLTLVVSGDSVDGNMLHGLIFGNNAQQNSNESVYSKNQSNDPKNVAYQLPNYNLDFFRFDKFNGYLKLKFKDMVFEDMKINDFYLDSVIENGLVKIRKLNTRLFDGYLQSLGNIALSPFAYNIAYSYSGGDIGKLSRELFGSERFKGKLNMTGNLYGKGASLHEVAASSGGVFNFRASKLQADKFNIKTLLNTYGTYLPKDFDNKIGKGSTDFKFFKGKAEVENGHLIIKESEFSADKVDGKLSSDLNLFNGAQTTAASFAYLDNNGKVDGFNISFVGPINDPKLKFGTEASK